MINRITPLPGPPTRWTLLRRVTNDGSNGAKDALTEFCAMYQEPITSWFVSQAGADDAKDLLQNFYLRLLKREGPFAKVEDDGRPFRAWLKVVLERVFIDWVKQRNAGVRKGKEVPLLQEEPSLIAGSTAAQAFDEKWLLTVLDLAMRRLVSECADTEWQARLRAIRPILLNQHTESHEAIAQREGWSSKVLKDYVFKLRRRFSEKVLEVVQETVGSCDDVMEELTYLQTLQVIHAC